MEIAQNLKNGQTFTNGTTKTVFIMIDSNTLLVRNTDTQEERSLTNDTHVYNVQEPSNNDFTKLENEVLEIISWGDEFEEVPTECFSNIMDSFKGSKQSLKGVLGSLMKKNAIKEGYFPNGLQAYHLNI